MSNRLIDTAPTADWEWLDSDNLNLIEKAAGWFAAVYGVDQDDLLQESLMWVAVRPNRRRDVIGLRGAVKKVAQDMLDRTLRTPTVPLMDEVV